MGLLFPLRQWMTIVLLAGFLFIPTCWAAEKGASLSGQKFDQEGSRPSAPMERVTIQKKALEVVITHIGDTYAITSETIIVGTNGKQVGIREMLVPCDADITYHTRNGIRQAERIRIKSVSPDATWKWFSVRPD